MLQAATRPARVGIGRVYSTSPIRWRDNTRFVFESAAAGSGVIRVFSVAGRTVAHMTFGFGGGGADRGLGRPRREGDELANGTYLYRVEIDGPDGRVAAGCSAW